jgi:hypothetical protein
VTVRGGGLEVRLMRRDHLTIVGKIEEIRLSEGNG